jgi:hypothetical protein
MEENIFTTKLYDVIIPQAQAPLDCVLLVMEYVESNLKQLMKEEMPKFSSHHILVIIYNFLSSSTLPEYYTETSSQQIFL